MMILSLAEDPSPLDSKQRGLQEGQEYTQPFAILGPKTHYKGHTLSKPHSPTQGKRGLPHIVQVTHAQVPYLSHTE